LAQLESDGGRHVREAAQMKLLELLAGLDAAQIDGDAATEIVNVRDDSRTVTPRDLFVATPGTAADGRSFLSDAIARGATALMLERPVVRPPDFQGAMVAVSDVRHALAIVAANRYAATRALTLSAVTGTNGKTTTTYLIESMLSAAGTRAGVVGTIAYRIGRQSWPAPLTTPGALALHGLFDKMHTAGATDVVLEASSIALVQARLDACRFRVAGLTNVTQDHLDYHTTMERYFDAKAVLFERLLDPATGVAVLPVDLPEGRAMRAHVRDGQRVLGIAATIGTSGVDVVVESATLSKLGIRARIATPSGPVQIASALVGDYNLANIVLAVGMGIARGLSTDAVAAGINGVTGVPGRLETVTNNRGVLCVVDYAHTPDALERAIAAMRPLVAAGGRLLTVFGCGGDRDRTKRPLMGQVSATGSDLVIVTSDNPRGEDPESIIAMVIDGVRRVGIPELDETDSAHASRGYQAIADRRTAIRHAVGAARAGDVLLIAGKGHEDYQIIAGQKSHFDDREEARAAFDVLPPRERPQ
jgi:UDP-N-acetylmuramoyl-L-alanyl-D-glutamate--2,6-diaminopimelate ligase